MIFQSIRRLSLYLVLIAPLFASADPFTNLPAGSTPQEVGKRITENYLARPILANKRTGAVSYPEVCAFYGSLTYAKLAGQADLTAQLISRFSPLLAPLDESKLFDEPYSGRAPEAQPKSPEASQPQAPLAPRIPTYAHVDFRVSGVMPLELYLQTKDERYLKLGLTLADAQWARTSPDGITTEARYWIDDMFMISALQLQAYRATGNKAYLDRTALAMSSYLDKLQQPNGLFFHASDSPFYWGRGNGWFAAGMTELLRELPAQHPQHARILKGYSTMMSSLLKYQSEEGLWRQLIDKPESWTETSGSAMFTYAMVTGVKNGWLDSASYGPAARKAWLALVQKLDADANLTEICVGTNKGLNEAGPNLDAQYKFYLARPRKAGDLHGQAPMLWTASALLR